jgi:hypothetical protein
MNVYNEDKPIKSGFVPPNLEKNLVENERGLISL